jgi:hypothetical protein
MSCLNDSVFFDDIYIQRGVRKIFYDKSISDEYVTVSFNILLAIFFILY